MNWLVTPLIRRIQERKQADRDRTKAEAIAYMAPAVDEFSYTCSQEQGNLFAAK
jgi:hypothetical protein